MATAQPRPFNTDDTETRRWTDGLVLRLRPSARSGINLGTMDPLTALAPNLWVATRPLPLIVGDIGTRMTVIRLVDGSLFLHSPVKLDAETRAALDAIGPVRAVVAPSRVHHFYVGEYGAAYPQATLYAAPGLEKKRADVRFGAVLDDEPPPAWAGQIDQHVFRGTPIMNEVVFFHAPTRTLLLTDLAFNVVRPTARPRPLLSPARQRARLRPAPHHPLRRARPRRRPRLARAHPPVGLRPHHRHPRRRPRKRRPRRAASGVRLALRDEPQMTPSPRSVAICGHWWCLRSPGRRSRPAGCGRFRSRCRRRRASTCGTRAAGAGCRAGGGCAAATGG